MVCCGGQPISDEMTEIAVTVDAGDRNSGSGRFATRDEFERPDAFCNPRLVSNRA